MTEEKKTKIPRETTAVGSISRVWLSSMKERMEERVRAQIFSKHFYPFF